MFLILSSSLLACKIARIIIVCSPAPQLSEVYNFGENKKTANKVGNLEQQKKMKFGSIVIMMSKFDSKS